MASFIFDELKRQLTSEAFDFDANEIRVILMSSSYDGNVGNAATQTNYGQIKANEIPTGGNYTAGGQALTSKTANVSGNTITWDCADVTWSNSTITNARYAIILKNLNPGGAVSDPSPLLLCYDFGVNKSSSNDPFTFQVNASGLLSF